MSNTLNFLHSSVNRTDVDINNLKTFKSLHIPYADLLTRDLDMKHVDILKDNLDNVPPIKVVDTDRGTLLIDGYHRVAAAKEVKRKTLPAEYVTFQNTQDVMLAAMSANNKHGRASSKKERKNYILLLHKMFPDMSQQTIANNVGVHQTVVSRTIKAATTKQGAGSREQYEYTNMQLHKIMLPLEKYIDNCSSDIFAFCKMSNFNEDTYLDHVIEHFTNELISYYKEIPDTRDNRYWLMLYVVGESAKKAADKINV